MNVGLWNAEIGADVCVCVGVRGLNVASRCCG